MASEDCWYCNVRSSTVARFSCFFVTLSLVSQHQMIVSDYRWGQHDTLTFLEILTSSVDKFSNPNIKRKFIWKDTCDQMLEKGFSISQVKPPS